MPEPLEPELVSLLQALQAKIDELADSAAPLTDQQRIDELTAVARHCMDVVRQFLELGITATKAALSIMPPG
jgi:hypothetical protein